jgi:maleylpyruvate isomerase
MSDFADDPDLAQVAVATDRLLQTVRDLEDEDLREPSACPGWTRAHVLAHVARNADAMTNLVTWAGTGRRTPMYPSAAERDRGIAEGAAHTVADLEVDLEASDERFLVACAQAPEGVSAAQVELLSGRPLAGRDIPWHRLKEVVVHHVDLRAGFTFADVEAPTLVRLLDDTVRALDAREDVPGLRLDAWDVERDWVVGDGATGVTGTAADLVGWLTGRTNGAGLILDGPPGRELPALPPWA